VDPTQISDGTLLGKFIRLPFKLLPAGAVVRIVRGPARGKRWVADSSTRGFWLGYWELDNQRFFAAHLRPGDVVYDIGAHVGLYTLISSPRVHPGGHVYAFEPLLRNLQYLRRHIDLNHVLNCTVVDAGVSDSTGPRRFDPTVHDSAGHFSSAGNLSVQTTSLDDFFFKGQDIRPPDAIKINAEGAEMEVLRGGRRIVAQYSPLIFLSTHSREIHDQCSEFLTSIGYSLRHLAADKIWAAKAEAHLPD
jgi:FkbM family methyltransferase